MAIYRLEAKIFSREKRGRSVVAAAAYRNGSKLHDERINKTHDYSRRAKGVIQSVILRPENSPARTENSEALWNRVEAGEKRSDAQLAREFILAVPCELSEEHQFQAAAKWAQSELVSKGMVAELSLHHPKDGKNPHVHILCTMRRLEGDTFGTKKPREWNDVALLHEQRESWATAVNEALEVAGRSERVNHRSLKDRGIDRIPEPKIGVAATAMKRRGVVEDPERFQLVRYVKSLNFARPWLRAIETHGEVTQRGMGATWWERSLNMVAEAGRSAKESVLDTWRTLLGTTQRGGHDVPSPDRDPDLSR